MVGRNKELSTDSVFSKEVSQSSSPINYVLMVVDHLPDFPIDELAITEAELFIKRLFVQGDYKHYADKFQIDRADLKRILYEATVFLGKKNIPCTIALILKPKEDGRDVFVTRTGGGASFIINSQEVRAINQDTANQEMPLLYLGILKKQDTLLLCSESLGTSLDLNFMQRTVIASKSPEEACKKLLHSASGTGRKDNISVAAFNGAVIRKDKNKERISTKTLLLLAIAPLLVLFGFLIYNLTSSNRDKPPESLQTTVVEPIKIPPVIKKDTLVQPPVVNTQLPEVKEPVKKPVEKVKKPKIETIKPPEATVKINKNLSFIVNGSVVMVSNWESVSREISNISWADGISDKKRVHKYADYTSIPSSVKVTFKDNSTRSYKIK